MSKFLHDDNMAKTVPRRFLRNNENLSNEHFLTFRTVRLKLIA